MSLMTTCNKCNKKIPYGKSMCDKCEELYKYDYDKRRNSYSKAFYQSKEWHNTLEKIKIKYKCLDIYEYYINGTIIYGDIGHHIEELRDNKNRRLDIRNIIYLTIENHNKIHALYNKSTESKIEVQKLLFNLVNKWNEEMGL